MKGIIVLDDIPKSCVECPMCYHAEDMSLGQFKYERLYSCKLEPEEVEQVYLDDILHKKPDWCPIIDLSLLLHGMREATPQENERINAYIESISVPTGVNIFDFLYEQNR